MFEMMGLYEKITILHLSLLSWTLVIGPVKQTKICVKLRLFSYPSILKCGLGAQKNYFIQTVLFSTHNICFG